MKPLLKNIALAVLVVASIGLNVATIHGGHNWGDDFAQYIIYAQNLLAGRPLAQGIMLGLNVFPPAGYSLFLAVVMFFRGLDFWSLKLLTVVFWMLMVCGYGLFLRDRKDPNLRAVLTVLLTSSMFFVCKQSLSPDVLFACCVVWAVFCFERYRATLQMRFFYCFLAVAALAVLTRNAGGFLLAAASIYSLLILKDKRNLIWIAGVYGTCVWIQRAWVGVDAQTPWPKYLHAPVETLRSMAAHVPDVFKSIALTVVPYDTVFQKGLYRILVPVLEWTSLLMLVVIGGVVVWRARRGRLSFVDVAFVCYLIGLISWSAVNPHPPDIFARYVIPVYGFIVYYLARCLALLSPSAVRIVCAVIVALNLVNIWVGFDRKDDVLLRPETQEMFEWVRRNTTTQERVMFTPPRALALMTGRSVGPVWFKPDEEDNRTANLEEILRWHYDYVIFFQGDIAWQKWLEDPNLLLQPVWENRQFRIYRILKVFTFEHKDSDFLKEAGRT